MMNGDDDTVCREDCTYCGDGNLDAGEECDLGDMNGMEGSTCTVNCECVCNANGAFDPATGFVTLTFDFCGEAEPEVYDFIGIYPCDAPTEVLTQQWYDTICDGPGSICDATGPEIPYPQGSNEDFLGRYVVGDTYVNTAPVMWTYTCGPPGQDGIGCPNNAPPQDKGTIVLDPSKLTSAFFWNWEEGATLEEGCYKVVMSREENRISPPPQPFICNSWTDSSTFTVSYSQP
jgi:hypothetical protein